MAGKTNALRLLERHNTVYTIHEYTDDPDHRDAASVAAVLHIDGGRLFKTLVTYGDDGRHYVFCIPGNMELDLKKASAVAGRREIAMLPLRELKAVTGYVPGGCSPFAMKSEFKTFIDEAAYIFDTVFINGGKRGLQIEISPHDLLALTGGNVGDVTR